MNELALFKYVEKQKKAALIALFKACYRCMRVQQLQAVFGRLTRHYLDEMVVDSKLHMKKASLAGVYYAPFDINSKNYTHVPEETLQWFETLADLLTEAGEEIIFADEYGKWMPPLSEERYINADITSSVAHLEPEDCAARLLPLLRRDSDASICNDVYAKVKGLINKHEHAALTTLIHHHKIKIKKG